jgi:hypothetical protein
MLFLRPVLVRNLAGRSAFVNSFVAIFSHCNMLHKENHRYFHGVGAREIGTLHA